MTDTDWKRKRAKIRRKIRWCYLHYLQEKSRKLFLYRSYRHYRTHRQRPESEWDTEDFYMTKEVHPGAGIGDQLASWISGYYYAGLFQVNYAHSRFYPDKWEEFFDFGAGEENAIRLLKEKKYQRVVLPWFDEDSKSDRQLIYNIMRSYSGKRVVFFLELNQIYTAQYGVMEVLQDKFNTRHPLQSETLIYEPDTLSIAVHIRRGDIEIGQVNGEEQLTQRWLNNEYYIRVLEQIWPLLKNKKAAIYLFSQGSEEAFREFEQFGCVHYCMNMPATDSFLHMTRADILITSKSSFSYKPALLSKGIKICPQNFWHEYPDDRRWIMASDTGELRLSDVEGALKLMKNSRKDKKWIL